MKKSRFKEIVKEVLVEENEYQIFFQKALEKAGKSIPQMGTQEKRDFFNKIDSAWRGRGEKKLAGNQSKLDVDNDGEIEASDLEKLRGESTKIEEGIGTVLLSIAAGTIFIKLLINAVKSLLSHIGSNATLSKEQLLKVVDKVEQGVMRTNIDDDAEDDIKSYCDIIRNKINKGQITKIKHILELVKANMGENKLGESIGSTKVDAKTIASKMRKSLTMKGFADKVEKMGKVSHGDLEKLLPDYVAGKDIAGLFESINEGRKRFHTMDNVGSSKYTINFHDGKSKHKDGSDFFGIYQFKNKKDYENKKQELFKQGYVETNSYTKESANEDDSVIGGSIAKKYNIPKKDGGITYKVVDGSKTIDSGLPKSTALKLAAKKNGWKIVKESMNESWVKSQLIPFDSKTDAQKRITLSKDKYKDKARNFKLEKNSNGKWIVKFERLDESINESKFKKDDLVYNTRTKTVGIVRIPDDKFGEVKTDADGNVDVDELEKYNPIKNKHQANAKVAPSTEKEVSKRGLFNPFSLNENEKKVWKYKGVLLVDSDFVNDCKGKLPNSELKHAGMGDFFLQTPDGTISFDRTNGKLDGMSGRAHQVSDNQGGKLLAQLIKKMGAKIVEE